jgi:hypothetical protein
MYEVQSIKAARTWQKASVSYLACLLSAPYLSVCCLLSALFLFAIFAP